MSGKRSARSFEVFRGRFKREILPCRNPQFAWRRIALSKKVSQFVFSCQIVARPLPQIAAPRRLAVLWRLFHPIGRLSTLKHRGHHNASTINDHRSRSALLARIRLDGRPHDGMNRTNDVLGAPHAHDAPVIRNAEIDLAAVRVEECTEGFHCAFSPTFTEFGDDACCRRNRICRFHLLDAIEGRSRSCKQSAHASRIGSAAASTRTPAMKSSMRIASWGLCDPR